MNTELKKSFWSDAAKAGGFIGVLLFAVSLLDAAFKLNGAGGMISLATFIILGVFIYRFGRNRAVKYGTEGFTYGQSMGYILSIMLFTGVIYGFGNFLLQNYIASEYYQEIFETALLRNPFFDPDSSNAEDMADMAYSMMKSPVFLVFVGIFAMAVYGGLIGLIASAFIRRKPDIFAGMGDGGMDNGAGGVGNDSTGGGTGNEE